MARFSEPVKVSLLDAARPPFRFIGALYAFTPSADGCVRDGQRFSRVEQGAHIEAA